MINCWHPAIVGDAIRSMKAGETLTIELEGVFTEQCGKVQVNPPLDFITVTETKITISPKEKDVGRHNIEITTEWSISQTTYVP